ncbi:MAG: MoaD/ThiS family protein [Bryobacteraceae bacterium]
MTVFVPGPLRSYTGNAAEVQAGGGTLRELLSDLDRRFPGMRFRMIDEQDAIRPHIKLFVNGEKAGTIEKPLAGGDQIHIICALSGG